MVLCAYKAHMLGKDIHAVFVKNGEHEIESEGMFKSYYGLTLAFFKAILSGNYKPSVSGASPFLLEDYETDIANATSLFLSYQKDGKTNEGGLDSSTP